MNLSMMGPARPPRTWLEAPQGAGLYLYCVADGHERETLGRIGLGGAMVYTKPHLDICAVVHRCPARPYRSGSHRLVREWIRVHQRVVEMAWLRWGTVLPVPFGAVFQGRDDGDVGRRVRAWLASRHGELRNALTGLRGKAEYRLRISWDPGAARYVQDLCGRIRRQVDNLRVGRVEGAGRGRRTMDLSCLASSEQARALEQVLRCFCHPEGVSVGLAGPLPPFIFAGEP